MSATDRVGLIGNPVAHSLSPAFQQAAFDSLGLSVRYELWQTSEAELPARFEELRRGRALGANVTVPHKEAACAAMDEISDLARRVGAVNTVVPRCGRLYGDNTDVHGFVTPLRAMGFDVANAHAVVLGSGGAARGVVVALLDAGASRVTIINRTRPRAQALAQALGDPRLQVSDAMQAERDVAGAQLLVNATSLGWASEQLPCEPRLFTILSPSALAYDLTYRGTPFLRAAEAARLSTLDGLPMLVQQGARSFELWTGHPAPIEVMWSAALLARDRRANATA